MERMHRCVVVVLFASSLAAGCTSIGTKMGRGLSAGAAQGLEETELDEYVHDLGKNVGTGAKEGLLSDDTKERLRQQAETVLEELDERLPVTAGSVRDAVVGEATRDQIRKLQTQLEETLAKLETTSGRVREELLGSSTRADIAALRDTLLGDESLRWVSDARERLLGEGFVGQARRAGRELIEGVGEAYSDDLGPKIDDTISKINGVLREADDTVDEWAIGFVVALVGGTAGSVYLVRKAGRHRQTVEILTAEINKIPARSQYDELVAGIRKESARRGLNGHLDDILQQQGLTNQPEWQDRNRKLVNVFTDFVDALPETETPSAMARLRALADEHGLEMTDLPIAGALAGS